MTTSSGNQQPAERESEQTPPLSSHSTEPLGALTMRPRPDPKPQSTVTAGTNLQILFTTIEQKVEIRAHKCVPWDSEVIKCGKPAIMQTFANSVFVLWYISRYFYGLHSRSPYHPKQPKKRVHQFELNYTYICFSFLYLYLLSFSSGMQSLLEEITATPGLMESLLSGPYVSSLLNCLSQNPDLASQVMHTQWWRKYSPFYLSKSAHTPL